MSGSAAGFDFFGCFLESFVQVIGQNCANSVLFVLDILPTGIFNIECSLEKNYTNVIDPTDHF